MLFTRANGRRCCLVILSALVIGSGGVPLWFPHTGQPSASGQDAAALAQPPQKALDLLAALHERHGVPLPGYIGGRDFKNRERRLPRGQYQEYDVNPKVRGRPRDAERIVIEQRTGKAYYTGDHYRTFVPLN
jgi:ribonuclease T1